MGELFEITSMKNVPNDNIVKRPANARIAKSTLDNKIQDKHKVSTTALLQSMMVNSIGVMTRFSRPFCSILPAQTSMMYLVMLRDI